MKILFPADPSLRNEGAFEFLGELTSGLSIEIFVLRTYRKPVSVSEIPTDLWEKETAGIEKKAEDELEAFMNILRSRCPGAKINGKIRAGEKEEVIRKSLKEENPELLLMVKKASHGLSARAFETISDIIDRAACPVLVFPENLQYRGLNKIAFATQFSDEDVDAVSYLSKLASPLKARIVVVNVYDQPEVTERLVSGEFQRMIREKTKYSYIEFLNEKGEDPEKEINEMIPEMNIDLLALSTRHRNILEKLYSPGLTWKMISEGYIPILAFHKN